MNDLAKQAAAVYNRNRDGQKVLRGYKAIDPSGHRVLIQGDLPKDPGWRYDTGGTAESSASYYDDGPSSLPPLEHDPDDDDDSEPTLEHDPGDDHGAPASSSGDAGDANEPA